MGSVDPGPGNQEKALRNRQSLKVADMSVLVERVVRVLKKSYSRDTGRTTVWPSGRS